MVLLDTNVFIYLANGTLEASVVKDREIAFASITKVEALGYSKITVIEQRYLEELFNACDQVELDEGVIKQAIGLRLRRSLGLGDAIIAATAIESGCELWTANAEDFRGIDELQIINPLNSET
jgi:predicted nucleic acid-binding protein